MTDKQTATMVISMDRWVGKVAIVTGASAGIGAAIADQLVENGLIAVGLARRPELIQEHAKTLNNKKGKLYAIKRDLRKEEDIQGAFKWVEDNLGPVHILINNAGTGTGGGLTNTSTEDWRKVFDLNVLGLCIATREAISSMKKHKIDDGHIIHIYSAAGHRVFSPQFNVYPASKFAVTALTETLRQELNSLGTKIRVTSISPGLVATELTTLGTKLPSDVREEFHKRPILKAADIADGVVYVLSTPGHVQVHELTIRPF
ncbi:farnesol dehydrogenase-like isoform X2 [Zophobas morio]